LDDYGWIGILLLVLVPSLKEFHDEVGTHLQLTCKVTTRHFDVRVLSQFVSQNCQKEVHLVAASFVPQRET
jgi:hypothetical protein